MSSFSLPNALRDVSPILATPFNITAMYRMRGRAFIHLPGTPMHSGVLIAAAIPAQDLTGLGLDTLLTCPHAFLYANQASSVEIELPFYNNTRFRKSTRYAKEMTYDFAGQPNRSDYLTIVIFQVSTLKPSTGSTLTLTGNVEVMFDEVDFRMPTNNMITYQAAIPQSNTTNKLPIVDNRGNSIVGAARSYASSIFDGAAGFAKYATGDIIDRARGVLKSWTGLHAVNLPAVENRVYSVRRNNMNTVDDKTSYEMMYPYNDYRRVADDFYFFTDCDEMDVNVICQKPQYVTQITFNNELARGALLMSRPIVPYMSVGPDSDTTSVLAKMAFMSQAWSGDLKLLVQSSMTNFQHCKMMVCLDYNPSSDALTKYPTMNDLRGCPNVVLEFSGGGTMQEVDLPFVSPMQHLPIPRDWKSASLLHGMVYIYLLEPLTLSDAQPVDAKFTVFLKGTATTQFYGYSAQMFSESRGVHRAAKASSPSVKSLKNPKEATLTPNVKSIVSELRKQQAAGSQYVKAQPQSANMSEVVGQTAQTDSQHDDPKPPAVGGLRPIVNIRDHLRRMYNVYTEQVDPSTTGAGSLTQIYPLKLMLETVDPLLNNLSIITDMYRLGRIGFKIKVVVHGAASVALYYSPPMPKHFAGIDNLETGQYVDDTANSRHNKFGTSQYNLAPLPAVEVSNYSSLSTPAHLEVHDGAAWTTVSVSEAEIPFQSYMDTALSAKKVSGGGATPSEDFGVLGVTIVPTLKAGTTDQPNPFLVNVFLAYDDATRLGMHTKASKVFLASSSDDNKLLSNTGSNESDYRVTTAAPAAWYTRT